MQVDVSVIIPNWNGGGIIDVCLESLRSSNQEVSYETIVVDNNSSDGSFEMLQAKFPWVTVVRIPVNRGFAVACNAGLKVAAGRYIWFLNADTEVCEHALDAMVDFMDLHPDVGALNPKVRYPDGSLQPSVIRLPSFAAALWEEVFWHTRLHIWFKRDYRQRAREKHVNYDEILEMEWLRGSCLFVRRRVCEQVGGFDPVFFFGHEEHDYSVRVRRAGWKLVWMPKAEIIHRASAVSSKFGRALDIWKNESKIYFWRKYRGPLAELILRALIATVHFIKAAALLAVGIIGNDGIAKGKARLEWKICRCAVRRKRVPLPEADDDVVWRQFRDADDWGTHGLLSVLIPGGLDLMDMGCGEGILATKLLRRGTHRILGIDRSRSSIEIARQRCERQDLITLVVADLEHLPLSIKAGELFDGAILADVLEHLESPANLLRALAEMFTVRGRFRRIFVSLPNVAYWRIRAQLLSGCFEYQNCGILDRTHRWFFTRQTAAGLLDEGGWEVVRFLGVPGYKGRGPRGRLSFFLSRKFPTLFSPQFIFECVPKDLYVRRAIVPRP